MALDFTTLLVTEPSTEPKLDMCKCSECGGTFKTDDCPQEHDHHDGWEMPAYTETYCPVCEDDGCIDDYWSSDESLKKSLLAKASN